MRKLGGSCFAVPLRPGWRGCCSIKEVLWHELAHNRFSEHDNDFKAFNSQLKREGNRMDWTQSAGHALGSEDVYVGSQHPL